MTPETMSVVLVKCVHCGKWNYPTIQEDGIISYPKGCQNRDCRRTTYRGETDVRTTPEFKAVLAENSKKSKGISKAKKPKTYAQMYRR